MLPHAYAVQVLAHAHNAMRMRPLSKQPSFVNALFLEIRMSRVVSVQGPLAIFGISRIGTVMADIGSLFHAAWRHVHPCRLAASRSRRACRRVEVDNEREDVEGEDEGDHPLENGGLVVHAHEVTNHESDGEDELDDDEDELDPEGYT